MTTQATTNQTKQIVTHAEFDKKVDVARAHFEYFDRMSPQEAQTEALKEVSQNFTYQQY